MVVCLSRIKVLLVLFREILDHGFVTAILYLVILWFDFFCDIAIKYLYPIGYEFPLDLLLHFMIWMCGNVRIHKCANISYCKNTLLSLKAFNQWFKSIFPLPIGLHLVENFNDWFNTLVTLPTNRCETFENEAGIDYMIRTEDTAHLV